MRKESRRTGEEKKSGGNRLCYGSVLEQGIARLKKKRKTEREESKDIHSR